MIAIQLRRYQHRRAVTADEGRVLGQVVQGIPARIVAERARVGVAVVRRMVQHALAVMRRYDRGAEWPGEAAQRLSMAERPCIECGTVFVPRSGPQRCCSLRCRGRRARAAKRDVLRERAAVDRAEGRE